MLTLTQAKPFIRVFLDFAQDPPDIDTNAWLQLISTMTAILLHEKQVTSQLSLDKMKELVFITANVARDIAVKCIDGAESSSISHAFNAQHTMLCSFLCLYKLWSLPRTKKDSTRIKSSLQYLANHVTSPITGYSLLHVISEPHNLCDVCVSSSYIYVGDRKVRVNPKNQGKVFLYLPDKEHAEFLFYIGEAEPEVYSEYWSTPLEVFAAWISQNGQQHPLIRDNKERLTDFVKYVFDTNVGFDTKSKEVIEAYLP